MQRWGKSKNSEGRKPDRLILNTNVEKLDQPGRRTKAVQSEGYQLGKSLQVITGEVEAELEAVPVGCRMVEKKRENKIENTGCCLGCNEEVERKHGLNVPTTVLSVHTCQSTTQIWTH